MKIYLSRPMTGHDYGEVVDYYNNLELMLLNINHIPITPMVKYEFLAMVAKDKRKITATMEDSVEHSVFLRDRWMVEISDIVLCDLSMSKIVSIGCMMELAWGNLLRKHTITILPKNNIHNHIFVHKASDVIFLNLNDAINYLAKLR